MKKILLAGVAALGLGSTAVAADLPARTPVKAPMMVAPAFSWTGCYIGANIGTAWRGNDGWSDSRFGVNWTGGNNRGFIGGGQVGCNYQFDRFVIGAEWDGDWGSRNGTNGVATVIPGVGTIAASGSGDAWVSTAAARFGVAFDRVLLYGKAGAGWAGANGVTIVNLTTNNGIVLGGGSTGGWVVGAGLEWAFADNWSTKFEWDYLARSGNSFFVPPGAPFLANDTFSTGNRNIQMVKLGLNYRFNRGAHY
jgi:outer membrane immunogenic protein